MKPVPIAKYFDRMARHDKTGVPVVKQRTIGTPYRRPIGTPLSGRRRAAALAPT